MNGEFNSRKYSLYIYSIDCFFYAIYDYHSYYYDVGLICCDLYVYLYIVLPYSWWSEPRVGVDLWPSSFLPGVLSTIP